MDEQTKTELKCCVANGVISMVAGYTVGKVVGNAMCGCSIVEKTVMACGTGILSLVAGKVISREFFKFCDNWFDTDLESYCDL